MLGGIIRTRINMPRPSLAGKSVRLTMESLESKLLLASDLIITEFVANNRLGLRDDDGDRSDWIEIFNSGSQPVDLDGYFLTDNAQDLTKWKLPATVVDSQAYEVIFASGKDRSVAQEPLHASFRLSATGESLMLVEPNGTTIAYSYDDYPTQYEDVSFGTPQPIKSTFLVNRASVAKYVIPSADFPGSEAAWTATAYDDSTWNDGVGSIGFDRTDKHDEFVDTDVESQMYDINTTAYVRYSFQLDDVSMIQTLQLDMRYSDGYVAYLNGTEVVRRFSPEELTYNAKSRGSRRADDVPAVEPVDLSAFLEQLVVGENVFAVHGLNRAIRTSYFASPELIVQQPGDVVVDQTRYFETPSPGEPNGDVSYADVLESVEFNVERGFFEDAQSIVITNGEPGASIVYTLDGSTPSANNGTIVPPVDARSPATATIQIATTSTLRATAIKEDYLSPPPQTNTYVFATDVMTQSADGEAPEGWPSQPINGQIFNYGMDPDIVEDPRYASLVRDALLDIPSISLVTDQEHLFDSETGIFVNAEEARGSNADWERPTSVELINPDGTQGFQIDAGFRIRGGASRTDRNAKHAFRLFFREEYGETKLRFPMFGDEGVDEFDNIDLRSPSLPSWHSCNLGHPRWGCKRSTFLRDIFGRDSQRDMEMPYTRSRYYHLYLNGQYWGMFQSQERSEASYAESYFGGDKSEYDVVKVEGPPRSTVATDGTIDAWRQLWEMGVEGFETDEAYLKAQGLNPDGTRNPEYPVLLNTEHLADYMVLQFYSGNWDGPISDNINNQETNNWYGILDRSGDTGFQFFAHDGEYMMFDVDTNRLGPWPAGNTFQHSNPQWLHQQLVKNESYRSVFSDRAYKHLFNDGALTPENSRERFLARMDEIDLAIIAESARWGDSNKAVPFNKEDWLAETEWILDTFLPQRTDIVIDQFKNSPLGVATDFIAPILSTVDAPTFSQHGGQVDAGFSLAMTVAAPTDGIYFTLDGTDPKQHEPIVSFDRLVQQGDSLRFHVPTDDALASEWRLSDFSDAGWTEGTSALGFEQNVDQLEGAISTDLMESMRRTNSSVYARIPFSVEDPGAFEVLELAMQYDDGFVAYLNGTEIARSNVSGTPSWDSRASARRIGSVKLREFETVDLTSKLELLQPGENVLAIQGVNSSSTDGDFFLLPELRAGMIADVGLSLSAEEFNAPVSLTDNTIVSARSLLGNQWSALNQVTFTVDPMPLIISEMMYHPTDPTRTETAAGFTDDDDFEYIEVMNTSDTETLDLAGVTISDAIDYTFSDTKLGPGQRAIVARNTDGLHSRYGTDVAVAGEYDGRLNNGTETVRLTDKFGIVIQEFTYSDTWYASTDGLGFSLEAVEDAVPELLSTSAAWHASLQKDGSPGLPARLPGDLNGDGTLSAADIDVLHAAINDGSQTLINDLNRDGEVSKEDVDYLVRTLLNTRRGDLDLDGKVNFADFLILSANFGKTSGWAGGDFDGENAIGFDDFRLLASNMGFDADSAE